MINWKSIEQYDIPWRVFLIALILTFIGCFFDIGINRYLRREMTEVNKLKTDKSLGLSGLINNEINIFVAK